MDRSKTKQYISLQKKEINCGVDAKKGLVDTAGSPIQGHLQMWICEACLSLQAANLEPPVLSIKIDTPCTFQSLKWHKLHAHIQHNCKYWKKVSDMEPPWSSWSYSCVNVLLNSQMHQKYRCCVWTLNSRRELDEGRNIPDAPAALTAFMKTSGPRFRIGL